MPYKFNPFTGNLDYYEIAEGGGSTTTKQEIIDAILVNSDETGTVPVVSVLCDSASVLYNDDEEL